MRAIIAVAAALALCGCEPLTPQQAAQLKADRPAHDVRVIRDDSRSVTCWKTTDSRGGISCLPNWMLVEGRQP
ncbi:hypothetical protein D3C85_1818230 [compost metagenome]